MAMLGEIPRLRGFLRLKGKMSYASQAPWIFTASVRDNILFGQDYERVRYNKVVKACDLNKVGLLMPPTISPLPPPTPSHISSSAPLSSILGPLHLPSTPTLSFLLR